MCVLYLGVNNENGLFWCVVFRSDIRSICLYSMLVVSSVSKLCECEV